MKRDTQKADERSHGGFKARETGMTSYLTEFIVGLLAMAALFVWVGKFRGG